MLNTTMPNISLRPDVIFNIGSFGVTNAMLTMWILTLLILTFGLYINSNVSVIPGRVQVLFEGIINFFSKNLEASFGSKEKARQFTPVMIAMFLMFFVSNQFYVLPIIGDIVNGEGLKLLKTPTAHFSLPIAIALVIVLMSHLMALKISPIKHIGNFIKLGEIAKIRSIKDVPKAFLELFLGALDIIGEIAKVVSLSARLFGNVLAGELMIVIISFIAAPLTFFFVPMPFIFLSLFSGLIQAFVFPLLCVQYIGGTVSAVSESK